MHVSDEVDEELQCFDAVILQSIAVGENLLEYFYPIHHAVVMVGCRALVPAVGQKTVPLVREARGTLGNIDKMPVVGFVALASNLVRPVCDRCASPISERIPLFAFSVRRDSAREATISCPSVPQPTRVEGMSNVRTMAAAMTMADFVGLTPWRKPWNPRLGFIIKNGRGRFDECLAFQLAATVTFGQESRLVLEFDRES